MNRRPGTVPALAWAAAVATIGLAAAGPAGAQSLTSPQACALDSLTLLSPDSNGVRIRLAPPDGRFGAIVQWARVAPGLGTCVATLDTAGSPLDVAVSGTYLDQVDRELVFTVSIGGQVGDPGLNRVVLGWSNRYLSRSGQIQGEINLSNNGGLWLVGADGNARGQSNAGLPMNLRFTSILAFAQSPADPQRAWLHLGSRGLWTRTGGGDWTRLNAEANGDDVVITAIAPSPTDPLRFAVGTQTRGLLVTADGGATFTRFTTSLDPAPLPSYNITALAWGADGRIWMSVRNLGVFVSEDNGQSFAKRANLLVPSVFGEPSSPLLPALVNQIVVDPADGNTVYFALRDYAVYRSTDAGLSWGPLYGSWRRPDDTALTSAITVQTIARHPSDPQTLLAGTSGLGLFRTTDGGSVWREVAAEFLPGPNKPAVKGLVFDAGAPGTAWAAPDGVPLVRSTDGGATWVNIAANPGNRLYAGLAMDLAGGGVWVPTYNGGIYVPGTPLSLSATMLPGTEPAYLGLELGLSVAFWGTAVLDDDFFLKAQDFQGYAVWRSEGRDPQGRRNLQLIGLYDKSNPQSCIEGYCGDVNYIVTPDCFEERRAACFNFSRGDTIEFFDDSIYNGFEYNYAVTTFDYGNTAGSDPASLTRDLLYSARYPGDEASPFTAAGALMPFRVDLAAAPALDGPEIYVYPNPLRRGAGFKSAEGERVVFTNLPPDSRIDVWTIDGDLVAELPQAGLPQAGGNVYWDTRNPDGDPLASGIYIWKVEMPERGAFYGKLVIIR